MVPTEVSPIFTSSHVSLMLDECKVFVVIKGCFSTEGVELRELRELRGLSQQAAYEPQRPGHAKKEAHLDWCWTFALMARLIDPLSVR